MSSRTATIGVWVFVIGAIAAVMAESSVFGHEIAPSRYLVGEQARDAFIPYVASHPLDQENPRITRVLFSIHSSDFGAMQYYENARAAASKFPGALATTLIIAPQLFEQRAVPAPIPEGLLYWQVSPFRGSARGAVGSGAVSARISAFEVMDQWLEELINSGHFPAVQDIVLVGHSAGGQFVQRYAMVGKFEAPTGIQLRYVVSAPSSYAYPSGERFDPKTRRFTGPDQEALAACPEYNRWGHGLEEPYAYFADMDAEVIANRYAERRVFYLCGANDNDPDCAMLGTSCGAMMQGSHRLERMQLFSAYLRQKYGPGVARTHVFAVVPGVGHHGLGTMTSPDGVRFIFGPLR
jgi:hypothetical protein